MVYRYVKAPAGYTLHRRDNKRDTLRLTLSSVLLTLGVTAFTSVLYPMVAYQLNYAPSLVKSSVISPSSVAEITGDVIAHGAVKPAIAKEITPTFAPEMVNTTLDYTNSNTWFNTTKQAALYDPIVYYLSIPKLRINRATVRNDHTDLKESLIHYPGTAMPGDLGNAVIFGHSVLPQFFNPANYLTIFSTLHTLKPGDEVTLAQDNATYTYRISEMYETEPDDLTPLAQSYGNRYLTIITCTPPGTYLRRLIIKAVLI
jgi:sortase A